MPWQLAEANTSPRGKEVLSFEATSLFIRIYKDELKINKDQMRTYSEDNSIQYPL